MSAFWLVSAFAVYALVMILIGVKAFRRVKTTDHFIIGGKSIGAVAGAFSAEAADMSAWLFMGLPGAIYISGTGSAWIALGLLIGTILNWVFVAKKLREKAAKTDSSTLPAFFKANVVGSKTARKILNFCVCAVILIFFSVYVGSGFVAGGKFFGQVFGTPYLISLLITASVILAYTFLGGFLSIAWTSVVQGVLMIVSVLFVPLSAMHALGSISQSFSAAPANMAPTSFLTILNAIAWGLGYFGMPHILIKYMAMKDVKSINKGAIIASLWVAVSLSAAVLIGTVGRSFFGAHSFSKSQSENLFIHMIEQIFIQSGSILALLGGFFLCAILCAIMSTAASQLLITASTVSVDIIGSILKFAKTSNKQLILSRVAVIFVALVGFIVALNPDASVMELVSYSWAGFGAAFGPLILMILFLKKVNSIAAVAAVVSGGLTVFIWDFNPQLSEVYSLLPAFFISLLVGIFFNAILIKQR